VLRLKTADYQRAMRTGENGELISNDCNSNPITSGQLPFLDGVDEHELSMLAMMTEVRFAQYAEFVISPGSRPDACFILVKGACSMHVIGHDGAVQTFQPGSAFGLGSLLDPEGRCRYKSTVFIRVDSVDAEFHLITRKALEMLPDVVNDHIQSQLRTAQVQDPIRHDVKDVIREDLTWLRQKQEIYAEFYRCSCGRNVALSPLNTNLDEAIATAQLHLDRPVSRPGSKTSTR